MEKIGIIGAGSWGTALATVVAKNGHDVLVWSIMPDEIEMLKTKREHVDKLPGVRLPENISFTTDLKETIEASDVLVLAVPSVFTRSTAKSMAPFVTQDNL